MIFKQIIKQWLLSFVEKLDHIKIENLVSTALYSFGSCGCDVELCYPFDFRCPENIMIGSRVFIGPRATIAAWRGGEVIIGDDVLVGPDVAIFGADHGYKSKRSEIFDSSYGRVEKIVIKKGAWIGTKAIILRGVTIGRGAIVGAGAVVTEDVPDYEIWAGNPANFKKKRFDS